MVTRTGFRNVVPAQTWGREAALVVQGAMNGKTNNVGDITLATGTAVTSLSFPLISQVSQINCVPTNTYAASLGLVWADTQTAGAATLRHVTATAVALIRFTVTG